MSGAQPLSQIDVARLIILLRGKRVNEQRISAKLLSKLLYEEQGVELSEARIFRLTTPVTALSATYIEVVALWNFACKHLEDSELQSLQAAAMNSRPH